MCELESNAVLVCATLSTMWDRLKLLLRASELIYVVVSTGYILYGCCTYRNVVRMRQRNFELRVEHTRARAFHTTLLVRSQ